MDRHGVGCEDCDLGSRRCLVAAVVGRRHGTLAALAMHHAAAIKLLVCHRSGRIHARHHRSCAGEQQREQRNDLTEPFHRSFPGESIRRAGCTAQIPDWRIVLKVCSPMQSRVRFDSRPSTRLQDRFRMEMFVAEAAFDDKARKAIAKRISMGILSGSNQRRRAVSGHLYDSACRLACGCSTVRWQDPHDWARQP